MRCWTGVLITLLIITNTIFAQDELKQGDVLYVKEASENLRLSPNGSVITKLPQATKVTVLGQQGNWVAVQIVGWIWMPSLIKNKDEIKGFTMRALHILLKTQEEADEIKKLLNSGKDFAELAKEKSIGPNAAKGGDLGVIHKGDLLPELDNVIRDLKPGEISDVVKSELGFHIFKRVE